MRKIYILLFPLILFSISVFAQSDYRNPMDIKLLLSANFAELRPNHFHSGIDLKTEGVINKPVYSIADGYVSRISVSPSGYGLAIYVNHTDGKTSVYGHCTKYAPAIAEYVKNKQYEAESFAVDLILDANTFPVKKGDLIAYSGNTGSSFGPHVHFEIRDTDSQRALDPLAYYKLQIKDTQAPILKGVAVYPMSGQGVVNGTDKTFRETLSLQANGIYAKPKTAIRAWGKIGVGVSAIDKMDDTHNVFGVKMVQMYCNNKLMFESDISSFLFEQTRMINSLTDFDYWYRNKIFYMKSFVEPGNKLSFYKTENSGYIDISEEKEYTIKYVLTDLYGNEALCEFQIEGKKMAIPSPKPCSQVMGWNIDNYYITNDFSLNIPKGYLYDDIGLVVDKTKSNIYLSDIYTVHDKYTPLDGYSLMKLKLKKDSLVDKSKYGIVSLNAKGGLSWVGGKYDHGYMTTHIRELGHRYAVTTDIIPPTITPLLPNKWVAQRKIAIKVSDDKSGIAECKGTIDGNYVLFEKDSKAPAYTYVFDDKRLKKGQKHKLQFIATDRSGNTSTYEYEFIYS